MCPGCATNACLLVHGATQLTVCGGNPNPETPAVGVLGEAARITTTPVLGIWWADGELGRPTNTALPFTSDREGEVSLALVETLTPGEDIISDAVSLPFCDRRRSAAFCS